MVAPFPPEKGDYSIYLCSALWLRALYARCRAAGVPSELVKPRYILPQTALNSRCEANPSLIALAGRVITPVCCAGPQRQLHLHPLRPGPGSLQNLRRPRGFGCRRKSWRQARYGLHRRKLRHQRPGLGTRTQPPCGHSWGAALLPALQRLMVRRQSGEESGWQDRRLPRHLDARGEGTGPGRDIAANVSGPNRG